MPKPAADGNNPMTANDKSRKLKTDLKLFIKLKGENNL